MKVGWTTRPRRRGLVPARPAPGPAASRAGLSRRLRLAFQRARPHLHQARPDPLLGRGDLPARARRRVQAAARPRPRRALRRRAPDRRGRPRAPARARCSPSSTERARSPPPRSPRSTGRASLTGEEVVVKVQRPEVAELVRNDLAAMSFLAPLLVGRIPVAVLANPPALIELFAETIVEELDFRLEAENMLDIAGDPGRDRPTLHRRAATAPAPRHARACSSWSGSTASPGTTSTGMRAAGIDDRGGAARRRGLVPRGGHALRRLPRRPARREPVRPARRARRPARLRDHRPPRRATAARLLAPRDGRRR